MPPTFEISWPSPTRSCTKPPLRLTRVLQILSTLHTLHLTPRHTPRLTPRLTPQPPVQLHIQCMLRQTPSPRPLGLVQARPRPWKAHNLAANRPWIVKPLYDDGPWGPNRLGDEVADVDRAGILSDIMGLSLWILCLACMWRRNTRGWTGVDWWQAGCCTAGSVLYLCDYWCVNAADCDCVISSDDEMIWGNAWVLET